MAERRAGVRVRGEQRFDQVAELRAEVLLAGGDRIVFPLWMKCINGREAREGGICIHMSVGVGVMPGAIGIDIHLK